MKRHGVSLADRCWPDFSGIWIHSLKTVGPTLKTLSGPTHDSPCSAADLMVTWVGLQSVIVAIPGHTDV